MNRSELEEQTKSNFLDHFQSSLDVEQFFVEMWGQIRWSDWTEAPRGTWMQIDILMPSTRVCFLRLSEVILLSPGLICRQTSCKYTRKILLEQSYSSTIGSSYDVSVSTGVNIGVVTAGITRTFGISYDHTWSHGSSTGAYYEFELTNGQQCIPSMVHVELECDIESRDVYYDTF